jgi:sulfiredoxin
MKRETLAIADIYVPVKRRATLEQKRVDEIAASMLEKGQETPIMVRADRGRFVLIEGLHRLEAAKALGEKLSSASLLMRGSTEGPVPSLLSRTSRKWAAGHVFIREAGNCAKHCVEEAPKRINHAPTTTSSA